MTLASLFRGSNVLITGGLGFIGSNLAIRLLEYDAKVTLLDSLSPDFGGSLANVESIHRAVTIQIGDLRDAALLKTVVPQQDFIFHLAGHVGHSESMRDPFFDLGANCSATVSLLEACRALNPDVRMLFTSTRQVYGKAQSLPVHEGHATVPIDVNGINKLAAEHYHLLYHRAYGIRSIVLRLTNTFGPRQKISSSRGGFAGFFVYQALRGETIRVFGNGHQRRDFNYVDDVVDAILLASASDQCFGQFFNLGYYPTYSLAEFVETMREFCDFQVETVPFPADSQAIEIGDYCGDFSRFHKASGWEPRVDLRQGLARTFDFYRQHAAAYGV